ncbi:MAG: 50S ribosomal protein L29 [Spirochaetes bacterium]|nr:50S ribosomal protein L29 [Spirochaetota bacterium]
MKKNNLKEKTNEELIAEKEKTINELKDLRFKRVSGVIENPLKLRTLKRMIARINTILHLREIDKLKKELMEN